MSKSVTVQKVVTNEVVINSFDDHFSDLRDLLKLFSKHSKLVTSVFGHERTEILLTNALITLDKNIDKSMEILSGSDIFNDGWHKLCTISYYIDMAAHNNIEDEEIADRLLPVYGYDLEDIEKISNEEEREATLKEYVELKDIYTEIIRIGRTEGDDEEHMLKSMVEVLKPTLSREYLKNNDAVYKLDKLNDFEFECVESLSKQKEGILLILSILGHARDFRTDCDSEEFKKADKEAAEKRDAKFYQLRKEADELRLKLTNSSK